MQITLTNDFHQTEAKLNIPNGTTGFVTITKGQFDRATKKLCGSMECKCGGTRNSEWGLYFDGYDYYEISETKNWF